MAHDAPNQTPGEAPRDGEAPADGRGPGLEDSLRAINAARREAMGASRGTARALRQLVSADVALARGALVRGLGWAVGALVFGASAWLLFAATLVALMQRAGLSWLQSLALAALLSLVATAFAGWRAMRYVEHVGMHATRRQLARLGLLRRSRRGNEDDDDGDDGERPAADATAEAAAAAARAAQAAAARPADASAGGR